MEEMNEDELYAENVYDNICDALDKIHANRITVLTGDNATGKSLIRRLVWSVLEKELGRKVKCADISMQRRTGLHSELGGGGVFLRDIDWLATSSNTLDFMKRILRESGRYIILDEPELGMSETLQKSIGVYLNSCLPDVLEKNDGVLIITHSKEIIRSLDCIDDFVNIQGLTKEEYLNKEPEVIDLEVFEKRADAVFRKLHKHLK